TRLPTSSPPEPVVCETQTTLHATATTLEADGRRSQIEPRVELCRRTRYVAVGGTRTLDSTEEGKRMTFRRSILLLALAGFLSLLVAGTGSGSAAPLRVAVEGPQTGSQAPNGLDQLRGVRLAVSQLNAHGGLWNGRKVSIVAADDKAEASRGRAVAHQGIAKGIRFVIGPYNSSVGLANLSIYRRPHVLPLWMTSEDKTGGIGATVQPMNSQIAPIEARFVEKLHAKKV